MKTNRDSKTIVNSGYTTLTRLNNAETLSAFNTVKTNICGLFNKLNQYTLISVNSKTNTVTALKIPFANPVRKYVA